MREYDNKQKAFFVAYSSLIKKFRLVPRRIRLVSLQRLCELVRTGIDILGSYVRFQMQEYDNKQNAFEHLRITDNNHKH
ncbi:hypothetical protein HanPI659440_Chr08g0295801 [Helianthus annuus]|nr:hypothetical protein HanPI659440_Chr08g0295801 [Helianthus annuus]